MTRCENRQQVAYCTTGHGKQGTSHAVAFAGTASQEHEDWLLLTSFIMSTIYTLKFIGADAPRQTSTIYGIRWTGTESC
jgi:hypothetical protein